MNVRSSGRHGQLDLLPKDGKSTGIGAWVHADRDRVAIKPGETVEIPFAVAVPDNATPGDYVGGIITSLTQADQAEQINVDRRLGIRIKLRVSGELKPSLAVEDLHVAYDGPVNPFAKGDATVTYKIHNTGNTTLSAEQASWAQQEIKRQGLEHSAEVRFGDYRDVPELFKRTAHFCERYDAAAFDPDAETLPLEFFEPMVRRVFAEPKQTLYKAAFEKIG